MKWAGLGYFVCVHTSLYMDAVFWRLYPASMSFVRTYEGRFVTGGYEMGCCEAVGSGGKLLARLAETFVG